MLKTWRTGLSGKFLFVSLLVALITGCSTSGLNHGVEDLHGSLKDESKLGHVPDSLSRERAWLRSRQVGKVSYALWFGLDSQSEIYEGRAVVHFELKDLKKSIPAAALKELKDLAQIVSLDFEGGEIHSLTVNGASVNLADKSPHFKTRYDGHRIYFHTSELSASGGNRIQISFSQKYDPAGQGFHRYKDPEDGQVYLYTDSEPYYAHHIFPCFDQPDLKASYELTVEAPPEWQIIANTPERDVSNVDGRKSWAFPPSPVFSTYLFEISAGPFASWKSDYDGLPLRLFARQSMKQYVDADEWFETTRQGLEYYNTYFGYPYPYPKYDQVIVPEYGHSAMENVSAITFSERHLFRSKPTVEMRAERANTILHEMAHQWFGDLVTLRWWNGLWLNESFATYMAAKAMADATEFPNIWQNFYTQEKNWAYREDQLVTTHPIEVPIGDTEMAEANFDGISYGKGAAVLQQLNYYLGDDDFREGLQRYFLKYALRNTTTGDFIHSLSEASGKDLQSWQKLWLQTAGVNGLRADWACDAEGNLSKFDLLQAPALEGSPDLRPHRTQIALYDLKSNGHLQLRSKGGILSVSYSGAVTPVEDLIGKPCPAFVFPNHNDFDYVKVELDPVSLEFARKNLARFENSFMRQVLWKSLYQMFVDGKLSPQELINTFLNQGVNEKNVDVLSSLLNGILGMNPVRADVLLALPLPVRQDYLAKLEATAMRELRAAQAGSDFQRIWFEALVRTAHSPDVVDYFRKLLDSKTRIPGFPLQQPERWSAIYVLSRSGATDAPSRIAEEMKHDPSDAGIRSALTCQAALPSSENKKKWLGYFLSLAEGKMSVTEEGIALNASRLRTVAPAYLSLLDEATTRQIAEPFFEVLPKTSGVSDHQYLKTLTSWLFPALCEPEIVTQVTQVLEKNPHLPPEIVRGLKIGRQEEQRCIQQRAKAISAQALLGNGLIP